MKEGSIMQQYAVFENGVFEEVLDEILKSQETQAEKVFFLQPHSSVPIVRLKTDLPDIEKPSPIYISTTSNLNEISYVASIVGWENKQELPQAKLTELNQHMEQYQPKEREVYLEHKGKKCINLIHIQHLRKLDVHIPVKKMIKITDNQPHGKRTRAGGFSYVYPLSEDLLNLKLETLANIQKYLEKGIEESALLGQELRLERIKKATIYPEKIQTISYVYQRNPDVIVETLTRAQGVCEECNKPAPFLRSKDNSPYLEIHHIVALADGGKDSLDNTKAMCPNCHKKLHFGKKE